MEDEEFPKSPQASQAWMVIFTDLVSLMLTFFVMLFAMSHVKVDRWSDMIDTLSQTLNPSREKFEALPTAQYNIASTFRKRAINLDYLTAVLVEAVRADRMLAESRVIRMEDRLVIALPGDLLFDPGRAVLSEAARQALFNLGGVLRNIDNRMSVHGHSDPRPTSAGGYDTNWELSLARAIAVANALRRSGYTEDIVAHGFAASRFPDLPEMADEKRRALARRVDIVVLPTVGGV